jgi:hypothetical protein
VEAKGAIVIVIRKRDLVKGAAAPRSFTFTQLRNTDGSAIGGLRPAQNDANHGAEFLADTYVVTPNELTIPADNRLGIWAITHQRRENRGLAPVLSRETVLTIPRYVQPQPATTPGGISLEPDEDSATQLQLGDDGSLWSAISSTVQTPGGVSHDGIEWVKVNAVVRRRKVVATLSGSGYVSSATMDLLYPVIGHREGLTALGFSMTGPTTFPSAGFVTGAASPSGTIEIAGEGSGRIRQRDCPPPATTCRWGDYSAMAMDPTGGTLWLAAEYIPAESRQGEELNYGTRVYQVGP